jgi:XTP/dITP diphosphohydrolase
MYLLIVIIMFCSSFVAASWQLNTSNPGKLQEFQRLFAKHNCAINATQTDTPEIESTALQVVVHKASQMKEYVIVEDTSLDIEGADVGINIRWLLDHISNFVGRKATWRVLLAYRAIDRVYVYEGVVFGKIVSPQGTEGFGFDPFFLPDGATVTLAQKKPDSVNARAKAVDALFNNQPCAIEPLITSWDGPWQQH